MIQLISFTNMNPKLPKANDIAAPVAPNIGINKKQLKILIIKPKVVAHIFQYVFFVNAIPAVTI